MLKVVIYYLKTRNKTEILILINQKLILDKGIFNQLRKLLTSNAYANVDLGKHSPGAKRVFEFWRAFFKTLHAAENKTKLYKQNIEIPSNCAR